MYRVPVVAFLITMLLVVGAAEGTQHLVRPGDSWESIDERLKPGDEIILMTGQHRPATLRNAQGTKQEPITIRGLDPRDPPLIDADRYGIRLHGAQHVRISDVRITGATINGILLEGQFPAPTIADDDAGDAGGSDDEPVAGLTDGPVTLVNLVVSANGPKSTPGQRHAIHVRYMQDVEIDRCRVEGWAGSGLEIVGCRNVRVKGSAFVGMPEFVQSSGIRVRAGSERVRIESSRFQNAGDQGVSIGAGSKPDECIPADAGASGLRFEARRVQVRRSIFQDGLSAVAFVNAERAVVRHCTIIRPRRAIISVRHEQKDARFGGIHRCAFGSNLVTWEPGDLRMITHVGPDADASVLVLEQNVWWSPDIDGALEELGGFLGEQAFPQITDVDPRLSASLLPQADGATGFGADLDELPAASTQVDDAGD